MIMKIISNLLALLTVATTTFAGGVEVKDGVIHCFPAGTKDGRVTHAQVGDQEIWVDAIQRDGVLRQVRVKSFVGTRQSKTKATVRLYCPEIEAGTMTWNMPVARAGDIITAELPWNSILIGDLMDVNEGGAVADSIRQKLGTVSGVNPNLPVLYSSGDSISGCYWPYLEADLADVLNVYHQSELAKDIPAVNLKNNGRAELAYGVLTTAYNDSRFKPDYILINFGLHMIASHGKNLANYGQWIEKFDDLARQHHAQLIWVMTTPYAKSHRPAGNPVIQQFNDTARQVAAKRHIPVVDLHACTVELVKEFGEQKVYSDGVHFTDEMRQRQAAFIAARVREILKERKQPKP